MLGPRVPRAGGTDPWPGRARAARPPRCTCQNVPPRLHFAGTAPSGRARQAAEAVLQQATQAVAPGEHTSGIATTAADAGAR